MATIPCLEGYVTIGNVRETAGTGQPEYFEVKGNSVAIRVSVDQNLLAVDSTSQIALLDKLHADTKVYFRATCPLEPADTLTFSFNYSECSEVASAILANSHVEFSFHDGQKDHWRVINKETKTSTPREVYRDLVKSLWI